MQTIFKLDLASLLYFFSFIHVEMLRLLKSDWQHMSLIYRLQKIRIPAWADIKWLIYFDCYRSCNKSECRNIPAIQHTQKNGDADELWEQL